MLEIKRWEGNVITGLLLVLVLYNQNLAAETSTRNAYTYFFDSNFGDFQEEMQNAKDNGKKAIMVFVERNGCPFCYWMKTHVLNQTRVQDYFHQHFLLFSVNMEGDIELVDFSGKEMTQKQFAVASRVYGTPTILFYDLQGRAIFRYTGRTSSINEFLWMGEYIVNGTWKKQAFSQYRKAKQKLTK